MVVPEIAIVKVLRNGSQTPASDLLLQPVPWHPRLTTELIPVQQQRGVVANGVNGIPVALIHPIWDDPAKAILPGEKLLSDTVYHPVAVALGVHLLGRTPTKPTMVADDAVDNDLIEVGQHLSQEVAEDAWAGDTHLLVQRGVNEPVLPREDQLTLTDVTKTPDVQLRHRVVGALNVRDLQYIIGEPFDAFLTHLGVVGRGDLS